MRKLSLVILFFLSLTARAAYVKGTITDEQGEAIPYASVFVKNSIYGVSADLKGNFFLELKPGKYTLTFSSISYVTQEKEITLDDSKPAYLKIILKEAVTTLGEVQVTTGNKDEAKEIMKKVSAKRNDYWENVDNYKCITYQKSSLEKVLVKQPKVDSAKMKADSIKMAQLSAVDDSLIKDAKKKKDINAVFKSGKLNLIESLSETYFKKANFYKEIIQADRKSTRLN